MKDKKSNQVFCRSLLKPLPRACVYSFLVLLISLSLDASAQREPKAYRTINTDQYEVAIHKNGFVDVRVNSQEIFAKDIYPMVWFDGEKAPEPLRVDPGWSNRVSVNNRLGEGQGMWFKKGALDWVIQTYPTKPYITIQLAFENTTKKPVLVKALIPWAVGGAKKGAITLGPGSGQAIILENGRQFAANDEVPAIVIGKAVSINDCAAVSPQTGFSLIAGFLTAQNGYGRLTLDLEEAAEQSSMLAECVFDPPVEVPPGKRVESDLFYVALTERTPFDGLEHFGQALGTFNAVRPPHGRLPHGWDSWNTMLKSNIDETSLLAALDVFDRDLKRYGWTHFAVGGGWQQATGTWEPDPGRFPHGMKWLAEQIHARKMTAGIWIDPFTAHTDSAVAREHPDWLREPAEAYRTMLAENERIIDVTIPEAYTWVRDLASRVGNDWGFDALQQGDFTYRLLYADHYAAAGATRVAVFHRGLQALREGLGETSSITPFGPVQSTAPIWRRATPHGAWGCVDVMTTAARRYYLSAYSWITDCDCAYFGTESTRGRWSVTQQPALTNEQVQTWFTAAALTGGVIKLGDFLPELTAEQRTMLTRLLPTLGRSARPVDLFEQKTPAIWSLPIQCEVGSWHIAGIFNWDDAAPAKITLPLGRIGLDPNKYYTVYDFWRDKYYGLAKGQVVLDMPPGGVRLLSLRPYTGQPMFLATDRHFTQGATDFTALEWNPQTRLLSGAFNGVAQTDYNLRLLVPEEFNPKSTYCSAEKPQTELDGGVFKIGFHCAESASVSWNVQF